MLKKFALLTLPTLARRDAPFPMRGSRVVQTLNVPQRVRVGPRYRRLTNSTAHTNVVLVIPRAVRLAAALLDDHFEHPGEELEVMTT